jgi:hypothetical protein
VLLVVAAAVVVAVEVVEVVALSQS